MNGDAEKFYQVLVSIEGRLSDISETLEKIQQQELENKNDKTDKEQGGDS